MRMRDRRIGRRPHHATCPTYNASYQLAAPKVGRSEVEHLLAHTHFATHLIIKKEGLKRRRR